MSLCDTRRFGRTRRLHGVCVLLCSCVILFAVGCKQSKPGAVLEGSPTGASHPTSPTSTQAVASPKVEKRFRCQSPKGASSSYDNQYLVDFDSKTVRTAKGYFDPDSSTISITEDAITFTQSRDMGQIVFTQHVGINRKDGAFTVEGKKVGKCVVVQEF